MITIDDIRRVTSAPVSVDECGPNYEAISQLDFLECPNTGLDCLTCDVFGCALDRCDD